MAVTQTKNMTHRLKYRQRSLATVGKENGNDGARKPNRLRLGKLLKLKNRSRFVE